MKFSKEDIKEAMLLYAITDRRWLKEGQTLTQVCKAVIENGATCLQIREKELGEKEFTDEAIQLRKLCNDAKVPFIVNDSIETAVASGADGLHVGQTDIKGRNIRKIIGNDMILGISASTVQEAVAAQKAGADYIGVGAVFATGTKDDAPAISMEQLKDIITAVDIPAVVIGGITAQNMSVFKGTGIAGISVISAIFAADDPGKATAMLREKAGEIINNG